MSTEKQWRQTIRNTEDIALAHTKAGGNFFDPDTRRRYRSMVSRQVYATGKRWPRYRFVTSERERTGLTRYYTVREWSPAKPGEVRTVSYFQEYDSREAAHNAAGRFRP